jgi:hypothetical protein
MSLVIWSSASKVTDFGRWLEKDLEHVEKRFAAFITISSARKATQAVVANICESR